MERGLDGLHDERRRPLVRVAEHHVPRVAPVPALHGPVRAREAQLLGRAAVEAHHRVALDHVVDGREHARALHLGALVPAALDEDREHGRAHDPRLRGAHPIEHRAVRDGLGLERDGVAGHALARDAEPVDHLEEELRVRYAERERAGLLLVDVLGEGAPHVVRRPLPEHAREEHGEVAHVDAELAPEVRLERGAREPRPGQVRPRPVVLSVHHGEEPLAQRVPAQRHARDRPRAAARGQVSGAGWLAGPRRG